MDNKYRDKKLEQKGISVPPARSQRKILVIKVISPSQETPARVLKFDKERIVLGSVISADVQLKGDGIAPIHAVLELNQTESEAYGTLFDLASETGVFVNGKKIVTQRLRDQDQITLGRHQLKFSIGDLSTNQSSDRTREAGGRTLFLNPNEDFKPLLLEDEREVEEIFDFRPTSKQALEVVMSWFGTILAVEHFVQEKSVTIGITKRSDFGIPPLLSSNHYPIVTQNVGGFVLNVDSQMRGVVQRSGELQNLDEIRNQALRGPNGHEIPIGRNDFAKISIGDIDFYFSHTAAPPRLKMRRIFERDPFFLKVFSSSLVLTALLLFTLFKVKVPLNIDAEQVPERIATILYQPEKFLQPPPVPVAVPKPKLTPPPQEMPKVPPPEPPKPKPVPVQPKKVQVTITPKAPEIKKPIPKVMSVQPEPKKPAPIQQKPAPQAQPKPKPAVQSRPAAPKPEAKEGEGARAKGAEGSRGEPDKKRSQQKVTELARPSPQSGSKGASGQSHLEETGNVDILKGAGGRIQNILGNSAAKLGEGSQSLKGFGNFGTRGNGGLALSGGGRGGGGDAETSLGGLGKKGTGMGRVGTGKGAVGTGTGIVGSQVRVAIQPNGPEETIVMGSIDRNAIAEAIYAHRDEFRLCYEREINAEHPSLSGQVGTSFVIGSSGRVTQAGVESSSLNNANAERCVLKVLKRIQFPMPEGGGIVEVRFPFKFSTAGH
jgi:TonB family protein